MKRIIIGGLFAIATALGASACLPAPAPPPVTTPPPITVPPQGCSVTVAAGTGAELASVVSGEPAGSVICLGAGTFDESTTPVLKSGDTLQGAGQGSTVLTVSFGPSNVLNGHKASNVTYEDFTVEGAQLLVGGSVGEQWGRGIWIGPDATVDRVTFQDNALDGIAGGAAGVLVEHSTFLNNGTIGGDGYGEMGGFKDSQFATVIHSDFEGNAGFAVWCDVGCLGGIWTIKDNTFSNNENDIRYEISNAGALIEGNAERGTLKNGVTIAASGNATVEYNVISGAKTAITVNVSKNRPPGISNDLIEYNTTGGGVIDGCTLAGVTCVGNT
jgi:hypothetical protein